MNRMTMVWIVFAMLSGAAWAGLDLKPAARAHVRYVDGVPMRFTSKLARVLELNFTLGFNHTVGKQVLSQMLGRMAADYALGPESAFTVKKFFGPGNGTSNGLPQPVFTLDDLQAADVIVSNNIGAMNLLPEKNPGAAAAFETAVRGGKSVLGFHGSGEVSNGWKFLTEEFFPLNFQDHGSQIPVPVYRNASEENHIVLQGVLDSGVTGMSVPMGLDSAGFAILKPDVPARMVRHEMHRYAMNPLTDPRYAPLSTCLLRFDPRSIGLSDLPTRYRFTGGNAYSCFWKVGAGLSAYIPAGHDNLDLMSERGFDGGVGDFERYFAQMLFHLAGYRRDVCGGSVECEGLPMVDAKDHLTGETYSSISVLRGRRSTGFAAAPFQVRCHDARGRLVSTRNGRAGEVPDFDPVGLPPGLYFLSVRIGAAPPRLERFLVPVYAP